jgi:hypothetical protein
MLAAALGAALVLGCNYSDPEPADLPPVNLGSDLLPELDSSGSVRAAGAGPVRGQEERAAILEGSIILIEGAALQPGGDNFKEAVKKLNQFFEGTNPAQYKLESAAREFLSRQLPPNLVQDLENRNWSPQGDTRHVEDCMMYYKVATRVAGAGGDLERVRRVFDWVVRQVQLVPAGSLRAAELPHVYARPYDVILRGMATESEGYWSERAWVFMALCRQLGIDTGLITYSRNNVLEPVIPRFGTNYEVEAALFNLRIGRKPPVVWVCAALIDDKAYLFDARLGMEVPGPGGQGVATLQDALADPEILERMNLPGLSAYGTSRASLLGSRSKIGVLIDSSTGYFSPKMKLLERELAGKDRTILYRDPAEQRDHFAGVLGDHCGTVSLWGLPLEVEKGLFQDALYVKSIQSSLLLFRPEFPLVYARVRQLRGETKVAIEDYVKFRFGENVPLVTNKRVLIPPEIQDGLDVFATYYLALAHLESDNMDQAELMFRKTLELLPDPGPKRPYYNMLRWGANANLARIYESKKERGRAVAYLAQPDPTAQHLGDMLRARSLIWEDPMMGGVSLPPAPPQKAVVARPAQRAPAPKAKAGP